MTTASFNRIVDFSKIPVSATTGTGQSHQVIFDPYLNKNVIQLTSGTSGVSTWDFEVSFNADSRRYIRTIARKPSSSASASFLAYLGTDTGFASGTWANWSIASYEGVEAASFTAGTDGINHVDIDLNTPSSVSSPFAPDEFQQFEIIRIRIDANDITLNLDSLVLIQPQTPIICLMTDDGDDSVYDTTFGLAKERNIPFTHSIQHYSVGQANYVTEAELAEMVAAGHSAVNHSLEGYSNWTLTPTVEDGGALINAGRSWLNARGYDGNIYVYPEGAGTRDTHDAWLRNNGYRAARTIAGVLSSVGNITNPALVRKFELRARSPGYGIPASDLTDYVDTCIAAGCDLIILFWHALETSEVPGNDNIWLDTKAATVLDHVKTLRDADTARVMTLPAALDELERRLSASQTTGWARDWAQ